MPNTADLTDLLVLLKKDNAGLSVWSARFECAEPGSAARMIASFTESASRLTARPNGGDRLVLVEFPAELAVAVARLALTVGATYVRRGLGLLPQ